MNAKISSIFYIKRAKPNSSGLVPIFQRITINGQRIERSTSKYIEPELWTSNTVILKGKSEHTRSINNHLLNLQNEVLEAEKDLILHRKEVNYINLKNQLKGKEEKQRTIVPIFKEHNDRIQALVATGEFAQGTVERYKTTLNHLKKFMEWKHNVSDITIDKIDYSFIMDFDFFIRTELTCKNNTSANSSHIDHLIPI